MIRATIFALLLSVTATATADGFDYDYLYLGYGNIDFDDVNADGNALDLGGTFALREQLHVFAGYESANLDFGVDASSWNAGLGYNTTISPTLDLYARLSYESVKFDVPGTPSADDGGLGFEVGARFDAGDRLEVDAAVKRIDFDDFGGNTSLGLAALYELNRQFAIGLGASWSDDVSSYFLTGRFYFGR